MNNVTPHTTPASALAALRQSDPAPSSVTLEDVAALLISVGQTIGSSVLATIADSLAEKRNRLQAIGELSKRITTLKQSLKDDKASVDLNDPKKRAEVEDIVQQLQTLVSSEVTMPTGTMVTQSYLDGWDRNVQTEQQRLSTDLQADGARSSTATGNQSAAYDNASAMVKVDMQMRNTIASAVR